MEKKRMEDILFFGPCDKLMRRRDIFLHPILVLFIFSTLFSPINKLNVVS